MYTDSVLEVRNPREANMVTAKVLRALPDARPILRNHATLFGRRDRTVIRQ